LTLLLVAWHEEPQADPAAAAAFLSWVMIIKVHRALGDSWGW